MSSAKFIVTSYRSGTSATAIFEEGLLKSYEETTTKEKDGTLITFQPDKKVFINATESFSFDRICEEIKNIAYLNKGIKFIIKNQDNSKSQEYYSKNGIADFIKDVAKKPLMKKPIICSATDGTDEVEVAFIWTGGQEKSYVFVNGLYCPEGGTPVTGAKTAITTQIKKLSGKNLEPESMRKGLIYAVNCKVANPSFANQTKSKINTPSLRTLTSQAMKEGLEEFSKTNDFSVIIEMMVKVQRAEIAADKAREAILSSNNDIQKELKKKAILVEKLADCRRHDESSQLMICEGKSAKGALVKARDSETTACFDLRGKIINALKNPADKVAANEEVKQLHVAFGCGVGDKFNIKKLRYGKIVIMADMDKDGYDIVCLVLTFLYCHYPELIKAGKVYWGVTPLFKVESKGKKYFAYNEKELKELPKGDITRLKG
jgi:DNA gyrase subunit B